MYLYWTVLLTLTMFVTQAAAAVATLPISPPSEDEQSSSHVHPEEEIPSSDPLKKYLTDFPTDDIQLGCKELRAKRFISDGFCTSIKPIKEVVCAGQCMPIKEQNLPWWSEFYKLWAKPKFREWRCVENVTKLKKVQLVCQDGTTRHYKIKIVKSCRCKSYDRAQNQTEEKPNSSNEKKKNRSRNKNKNKSKREGRGKRRSRDKRDRELRRRNRRKNKSTKVKEEPQLTRDTDSKFTNERHTHSPVSVSDSRTRHPVGSNASPEL